MAPTTDPAAAAPPPRLTAAGLVLAGRSGALAPPLELAVGAGQVAVAGIGSAVARTATGLALTGQLRGWAGRLTVDGSAVGSSRDRGLLRRVAALVDPADPADTAGGLPVAAVAAEQLAAARVPVDGGVARWLAGAGLAGSGRGRLEELPAGDRTRLLTELALARPGVGIAVLDSPDRHDGSLDWVRACTAAAADGVAVVALVAPATAALLAAASGPLDVAPPPSGVPAAEPHGVTVTAAFLLADVGGPLPPATRRSA